MLNIFYCEQYPIEDINYSKKVYHKGSEIWRPALADNIREHGLVNPLMMSNDRGEKYEQRWLQAGNNRLWAIKELGWTHVPVIITGSCAHPCKQITLEQANDQLGDGYFVIEERYWGPALILKDACSVDNYDYPSNKK